MGKSSMSRKHVGITVSLLVVGLLLSASLVQAATITVTGTSSNRYPSANVDIDGDGQIEWIMEPNLWNVVSGDGSVTMTFDTSTCNLDVNIDLSNIVQEDPNGWVHAYPEIWYGAKAWNTLGPANDGPFTLPEKLSELNDFTTTVTYSVTRLDTNLPFNFPLETWLTNDTSRGDIQSEDVELMIWLPSYNQLQGAGSQVGTVTIGDYTYEVWRSDAVGNGGWEYFAYRPTISNQDSGTITIQWGPFIQDAQSRSNRNNGDWSIYYFTAVELGTEFGSPDYLESCQLKWSLSNYKPSTAFSVLSGNILTGEEVAPPPEDTTPPAAPTGLTATAVSSSQIDLDWNNNTEADLAKYKVYRSTDGVSFTFVAETTVSAYSDTGLSAETTYYYYVTAVDTSGNESDPSATASATTQAAVAPPPPAEGDLRIQYYCAETASSTQQIKPHVKIFNDGTTDVALTDITIRYWFTSEAASEAHDTYYCDYAAVGTASITSTFGGTGNKHYLEVGFTSSATVPTWLGGDGTANKLPAGANTGEIQNRICDTTNWTWYDQTNDYSFDPTFTAYANYTKITVYYQGALVWGTEPA